MAPSTKVKPGRAIPFTLGGNQGLGVEAVVTWQPPGLGYSAPCSLPVSSWLAHGLARLLLRISADPL